MITDVKSPKIRQVTYKVEESLSRRFGELCKEHGIKQTAIIKKAMTMAIKEFEKNEVKTNEAK